MMERKEEKLGWLIQTLKPGDIIKINAGDQEILFVVKELTRGEIKVGWQAEKKIKITRL